MKKLLSSRSLLVPGLLLAAAILPDFLLAQSSDAKQIVSAAVDAELFADHNDRTAFEYRDHDVTPDHDTVYYIVQYPKGALKRKTEDHGHPLTAQQRQAEDTRIRNFVNDPALQEKARRDSAHDDAQAEEFLKLLPSAFLWTVQSATPASTTLTFRPDPNFSPRSLEARVLGAMSGEMVVMRGSNRIHIIRGTLREDVKFGFGILGRLRAGGTFNVERREIVPGHWQITDSHIHFDGRALFFKNIGEQEDETLTDFKISGAANIDQAAAILENVR